MMEKEGASISEEDVSIVLQRYSATTILAVLHEVAQVQDVKIDWNALVKHTKTGITNPREYQMLWRHLAYCDPLLEKLEKNVEPVGGGAISIQHHKDDVHIEDVHEDEHHAEHQHVMHPVEHMFQRDYRCRLEREVADLRESFRLDFSRAEAHCVFITASLLRILLRMCESLGIADMPAPPGPLPERLAAFYRGDQ